MMEKLICPSNIVTHGFYLLCTSLEAQESLRSEKSMVEDLSLWIHFESCHCPRMLSRKRAGTIQLANPTALLPPQSGKSAFFLSEPDNIPLSPFLHSLWTWIFRKRVSFKEFLLSALQKKAWSKKQNHLLKIRKRILEKESAHKIMFTDNSLGQLLPIKCVEHTYSLKEWMELN